MAERILKRIGVVRFVTGGLDLLLPVAGVAMHASYQACWWLPGVIGGTLLVRGSLRTASIVRQVGAFCAAAAATVVVTPAFLQPIGLLAAWARQEPIAAISDLVRSVAGFAPLTWIMAPAGSRGGPGGVVGGGVEASWAAGRRVRWMWPGADSPRGDAGV